ncbi:hypothetical protein [Neorhizobium sp. NCHU2750]|uniref:hypothetical protein n=1 Tax=Neorhizobium sp. NCHU2750 TaxID=1825976 RepID=UPI0013C442B0
MRIMMQDLELGDYIPFDRTLFLTGRYSDPTVWFDQPTFEIGYAGIFEPETLHPIRPRSKPERGLV